MSTITALMPGSNAIELEMFYRRNEAGRNPLGLPSLRHFYSGTRISIVPKLLPLWDCKKAKYCDIEFFLLKGGRGGAKSETIGELLVFIAREEKTRILCTREIQNSIADSVKKVVEEWIHKLGFSDEFHITDKKIVHKVTGTDFIFMGVKSGTDSASIKSLKGVKYIWVEEAQTLSRESWDILEPTFRIDGRKFFFSYNPRTEKDFVDTIKHYRKALLININYDDNPFLPQTSLDSCNQMKELDQDRWLCVWKGQPMAEDSSSIILPYSQLLDCVDLHKRFGHADGQMFGGFDIAEGQFDYHDKNAFALRQGPVVRKVTEWRIGQIYESVRKVHGYYQQYGYTSLAFDAIGVGVAAKSEWARIIKEAEMTVPYDVVPIKTSQSPFGADIDYVKHGAHIVSNAGFFANVNSQSAWNLKLRLQNSLRLLEGRDIDRQGYYLSFSSDIKDLDSVFSELSQATYKTNGAGKIQIDKAPGIKEIRVDGKKKIIKSPNVFDAIRLSFYKDFEFGLRAHGDEAKKAEIDDVPEPINKWVY